MLDALKKQSLAANARRDERLAMLEEEEMREDLDEEHQRERDAEFRT